MPKLPGVIAGWQATILFILTDTAMFKALKTLDMTLFLINDDNLAEVNDLFRGFADAEELLQEIYDSYRPRFEEGRRTNFGFYAVQDGQVAGLSLLTVDSFKERRGSTGADTPQQMRGQGIAPRSKPHLFYLAFELLGLNRVETGCLVSNLASKRSIEKTRGFQFEGIARESGLNVAGELEDQYLYAILRRDWLEFYDKSLVQVVE